MVGSRCCSTTTPVIPDHWMYWQRLIGVGSPRTSVGHHAGSPLEMAFDHHQEVCFQAELCATAVDRNCLFPAQVWYSCQCCRRTCATWTVLTNHRIIIPIKKRKTVPHYISCATDQTILILTPKIVPEVLSFRIAA